MNIGAIGWWNYGNQGDRAILCALRQGLAPHRIVAVDTGFAEHPDTINRLNRLDYVLLGGGTLIRDRPTSPFDTFDRWAGQLHCPLGVVGLGVDPFQEQYWPAVEAMLDSAKFFYVRDTVSRDLLRGYFKVQVAPDLTFAYPLAARDSCPRSAAVAPVCGVNLRSTSRFDPTPWLDALARLPVRLRGVPFIPFEEQEGTLLRQLDPETPRDFDADLYRRLDLMIGTAFHSVLFAVQAAVPVIAIDYAPKVRNFMQDSGLARYLLAPDEYDRLPELVDDVLTKRSEITADLLAIRRDLSQQAERNLRIIREQIERSGPRHQRRGPKATIAVVSSGRMEEDQRSLTSCAAQTYENVEVLIVSADPQESVGARLQQALERSSGEYLTWIEGGDRFAEDAVDCLVGCLEEKPDWDVVYTDYYVMSDKNLPVGRHTVPGPEKLYRRDVVGPCFLMRRALLPMLDQAPADTPLPAYSMWLRARPNHRLVPFHAPLFYSSRRMRSSSFVAKEREVRRRWRRTGPLRKRIVWGALDSAWGERLIVQPIAHLMRQFRRRSDAERF